MQAFLKAVKDCGSYAALTMDVSKTAALKKLKAYEGRSISLSIDELKLGRTLTQNAYLWVIVGKIAEKLRRPKDEIYIKLLKDYGQSVMVSVLSKDAASFEQKARYWELESKGDIRTVYRFIAGSSEYDTQEMKALLDGVIREAEDLGIPTLTTAEIEKMKLK